MRCVILGAGALGTILAAHLRRAGHAVTLIARGRRAAWLRAHGLSVHGLAGIDIDCEICEDPAALRGADLFVNTVKTCDSRAALAPLARLGPAVALSVQNGVVKEEDLCGLFGADSVLGAMADFSGELLDDGGVLFTRNVCLHLGELAGGHSARTERIVAALDAAGINARASDAITTVIWSKYVGWVALMMLAVLTRRRTAAWLADPDSALVVARITREMATLAAARDIPLRDQSPLPVAGIAAATETAALRLVQEVGANFEAQASAHRMSSLQDLLRGRPLEVEETVGHALALGERLGVPLPVTETCYRLVATINRGLLAGRD
jgi:2-dehydropantoate 2-reductase